MRIDMAQLIEVCFQRFMLTWADIGDLVVPVILLAGLLALVVSIVVLTKPTPADRCDPEPGTPGMPPSVYREDRK